MNRRHACVQGRGRRGEAVYQVRESSGTKCLSEQIRKVAASVCVQWFDLFVRDVVADAVISDVDVFGSGVDIVCGCKGFGTLVINVQRGRSVEGVRE